MKAIPLSGFGIATLFRLGLPGILLAFAFQPLTFASIQGNDRSLDTWSAIALSTIFLGWLISLLDMHIYMLFEGRRYWPKPLLKWGLSRERRRLERLKQLAMRLQGNKDERHRYLETYVDIALFPLDDAGEQKAIMPTRLGNIIAEYEGYPSRKYGLDAIFFFERIWLSISDELRDELDKKQAQVDAALYISFSLIVVGNLFLVYGFFGSVLFDNQTDFTFVNIRQSFDTDNVHWHWFLKAAICFLISYLIYRASLRAHARFGDAFKAMFDQHRDQLKCADVIKQLNDELGKPDLLSQGQRAANMNAWRFLRWHCIRLPGSKVNNNFEDLKSEHASNLASQPKVCADGDAGKA